MAICGIYRIKSPSGRVYIGQSCDIMERISAYKNRRCKRQALLYSSIEKYGWSSHEFKVIFECPRIELNKWEIFYIDLYDSFDTDHGMNLSTGGNMRYSVSASTKNKIKEKRKLQVITEEARLKMSAFQSTRIRKKETYLKVSERLTGRKLSPEHRAKCALGRKGKKLSEDHKNKISAAHTGKKRPPETGLKISLIKKRVTIYLFTLLNLAKNRVFKEL